MLKIFNFYFTKTLIKFRYCLFILYFTIQNYSKIYKEFNYNIKKLYIEIKKRLKIKLLKNNKYIFNQLIYYDIIKNNNNENIFIFYEYKLLLFIFIVFIIKI